MAIGGYYGKYGDDVELVPLDPILYPVPDCLTELNPLPVTNAGAAGGLDYSGKFVFSRYILCDLYKVAEVTYIYRGRDSVHMRRQ